MVLPTAYVLQFEPAVRPPFSMQSFVQLLLQAERCLHVWLTMALWVRCPEACFLISADCQTLRLYQRMLLSNEMPLAGFHMMICDLWVAGCAQHHLGCLMTVGIVLALSFQHVLCCLNWLARLPVARRMHFQKIRCTKRRRHCFYRAQS